MCLFFLETDFWQVYFSIVSAETEIEYQRLKDFSDSTTQTQNYGPIITEKTIKFWTKNNCISLLIFLMTTIFIHLIYMIIEANSQINSYKQRYRT